MRLNLKNKVLKAKKRDAALTSCTVWCPVSRCPRLEPSLWWCCHIPLSSSGDTYRSNSADIGIQIEEKKIFVIVLFVLWCLLEVHNTFFPICSRFFFQVSFIYFPIVFLFFFIATKSYFLKCVFNSSNFFTLSITIVLLFSFLYFLFVLINSSILSVCKIRVG